MRVVRTPAVETSSRVAATMGAVETWAAGETEIRLETARCGSSKAGAMSRQRALSAAP
jgi:hypothetical protein